MVKPEMELPLGVRDQQWKSFVARLSDSRNHIKICRGLTVMHSVSYCASRLDSTRLPCPLPQGSNATALDPSITHVFGIGQQSLFLCWTFCMLLDFVTHFMSCLCSPAMSLQLWAISRPTQGRKSSCTTETVFSPLAVLHFLVLGFGLQGDRCS